MAFGRRRFVYGRAKSETITRDTVGRRLLLVADVLAAAIALLVFIPVLGDDTLAVATLAALPIVVLISKLGGLYDRDDLLLRKHLSRRSPALLCLSRVTASVRSSVGGGRRPHLGLWLDSVRELTR